MKDPRNPQATPVATERRPWAAPRVRTTQVETAVKLLCTSGVPYECEGGGCCDVDPDCSTICNGG